MCRLKIAFLTVVAFAFLAAPAHAQLARTFVSAAAGDDSGDCNRLAPCRTFQAAHDKTLPLGEITVLDPGGYGAVTITKAISIVNDGVGEAGMVVTGGGAGITINAGASDAVSLRGITVNGNITFGGGNGIVFNSGKALTVENCVLRGLDLRGIHFMPNASSTLAVSDTLFSDGGTGILFSPRGSASDVVTATLSRVRLHNNDMGISTGSGVVGTTVTIADTVAFGNQTGISVSGGVVAITRSALSGNGTELFVGGGLARVSQTTIGASGWRVGLFAGAIQSYGDNWVGPGIPMPLIPTK